MTVALLWFRRNLRLSDNSPLLSALERAETVVPVFVHRSTPGAQGPGMASISWLRSSLASLDLQLRERGSALIMRTGMPPTVLASLAEETGARTVHCERDWTPEGLAEERAVGEVLAARGVALEITEGQLLVTPTGLATKAGGAYGVFTPFWRAWRQAWAPTSPTPAPRHVPAPAMMPATDDAASPSAGAPDITHWWEPGEPAAQARLAEFVDEGIAHYDDLRDRPSLHATSELSPRLSWGEISAAQVARSALSAGGDAAEPFLRQLAWREFSYHVLYRNPDMETVPLRAEFALFPWSASREDLEAWRRGMTGYPLVDAGMRQLDATGWMHNRVRLVVASFLTKDLLVRWQSGEEVFRQRLADYDPAANAFNWQWVAGCGADAAPYFRIFNPSLQGARFDPDGDYVRAWVPELKRLESRWIHRPWDAPGDTLADAGVVLGRTYPDRIVDHAEARDRALAAYESIRVSR